MKLWNYYDENVSEDLYTHALEELFRSGGLNQSHKYLLFTLCDANDRTASPEELALAAGYKPGGVHGQIGTIGGKIAKVLKKEPKTKYSNGKSVPFLFVGERYGYEIKPPSEEKYGHWKMHENLAKAIEKIRSSRIR
jgi:hypothetical protein